MSGLELSELHLQDYARLLFRCATGGSLLFFGVAELSAGRAAWLDLGAAVGIGWPAIGTYVGLCASLGSALGGALLVVGLWTRRTAWLLAVLAAAVAAARWPAIYDGKLANAAAFFHPVTLSAAMVMLATHGGGRYGLDSVRRERRARRARRS